MVAFTTNIALAKPTDTELAVDWVEGSQYQDDNNTIIETKTNIGLTSYTPAIIGNSSAFTVGSTGVIQGEYQDIQTWITGSFVIEFNGTGITNGGGEYGFSLPFPADGSFHTIGTTLNGAPGANSCIGEGYLNDASAIATSGTCGLDLITISSVSYARIITETFAGKNNRMFRDNMPFGFAAGDSLTGTFFYKRS